MNKKKKAPCDCLNICGDDPWLKDGRSQQCEAAKQRAMNEASFAAKRAAEQNFFNAAIEFAKAHAVCDDIDGRDEGDEGPIITMDEHEAADRRYNKAKAALVVAYKVFIAV
jgi:hypothetical protein